MTTFDQILAAFTDAHAESLQAAYEQGGDTWACLRGFTGGDA